MVEGSFTKGGSVVDAIFEASMENTLGGRGVITKGGSVVDAIFEANMENTTASITRVKSQAAEL